MEIYAAVRDRSALAAELPAIACRDTTIAAAGLHLHVGFDVPLTETEVVARAAAAGVYLDSASACYLAAPPPMPTMLLGYASLPEERLWTGVRLLARALR